ncbi:MAG: chemotaxis protein CheC [Anaerotruncus sp.]|nr:chemotaxis protein CheC [Anaerotruncus sp.]
MALNNYDDLDSMQIDVLREIGNIGSGNVATSLSEMLFRPVNISVPVVRILDYQSVVERMGGPETMILGAMLSLEGDVTGMIMFLLHKEFAHMTLDTLLGQETEDLGELGEMEYSALTEVSNIMAASYVNALSALTGLNINISVPDICIDMLGAIISVPAIHYADIGDKIIFIEDKFSSEEEGAESHILMIPEMESLRKILTELGIAL